jgi:8-oxo-dGTP pyrophosphatase MutT (NUDIX family)
MSFQPITRYSTGIACCRRQTKNDPYELLLVQRRTTYAFNEIILGRFKLRNLSKIKFLIKNTTAEEQNELLTKNFEALWWRATRYKKEDDLEFYMAKFKKFDLAFNRIHDLNQLISQSSSILNYWEIPKGKHSSKKETDINCAVREFSEETNIPRNMYQISFDPISYSYQDNNYIYNIKYYPAKCFYAPQLGFLRPTDKSQVSEIVAIRWMTMTMIRAIGDKRLINLARRILERL